MSEITLKQKLKIEAEVAKIFKNAHHKAGLLLEAFKTLKYCDDKLKNYYCQTFKEYIKEDELTDILNACAKAENSYYFWINYVLEEMGYYIELNQNIYEKEIKYTFYCYIDQICDKDFYATKELLNAVLQDERFLFMHQIALLKLKELQCIMEKEEYKIKDAQNEDFWKILFLPFNPDDESLYDENYIIRKKCINEIEDMLYQMDLRQIDMEPHEVQRISKETQEIVGTETFRTKYDAEFYLKNKLTALPELTNFFEYKIVEKE